MVKSSELLSLLGVGIVGYLMVKGTAQAESKEKEVRKAKEKEVQKNEAKKELVEQTQDIVNLYDPKTGKFVKAVNLDTVAGELKEALLGQWYNEDEERVLAAIRQLPKVGKSKETGKYWYPIQTVSVRYTVKAPGHNLKQDLQKLLSPGELAPIQDWLKYV